jgi:outer membrane protein TolC
LIRGFTRSSSAMVSNHPMRNITATIGALAVLFTMPALHAQALRPGSLILPRDGRLTAPGPAAQPGTQALELTLERMIELGLRDSYRVRQLRLEVERTRSLLRAAQAGLKSSVELEIAAPEFQSISENKWNSVLQRNELIAENTRRWQANLSIRQPVILFGFPTNGYLSLNTRVYRYTQIDGTDRDNRYYNRYFVAYDQPLFQPNRMKNNLEEAQLDLENSELDYQDDIVGMIDDLAGDFYDLLEDAHRQALAADVVSDLEAAVVAARGFIAEAPTRAIEVDQLQVELANAREAWLQAGSSLRLQTEDLKQRLQLPAATQVIVRPVLEVRPVAVDAVRAIDLARTLAPRMRQLDIQVRENEIRLDETKGDGAFRMNVGFTYGREMQNPLIQNLLQEPRNSYTIDVTARVPIWDWGQRRHRIQAQVHSLERSQLSVEETQSQIETNVRNQVRSLEEYRERLVSMQDNLNLARGTTASTLERYQAREVSLVDLLQTIGREASTADNFLDAYMGYQATLRRLAELTHYDFEHDMPIAERFSMVSARDPQ